MSVFKPDPELRVYKVDDTSKVTAKVTIGEGQRGGWSMGLGDQPTKKGSDEKPVDLGTGQEVRGQFLQVDVTVVDVRIETNRLSSVVTIDGGPAGPIAIPQVIMDNADGDVALFSTVVMFQ
jgi:hypothetical protein